MKQFPKLRFFLAIFLLFTGAALPVSAFTIASIYVTPRGDQAAGTPMNVNTTIDFSSLGTETFPLANELQMSTDLADPHWVPVLIIDGVKTGLEPNNGRFLILPGWYLSYPRTQSVQVQVTVTGTIPENRSQGQDILKVQEMDPGFLVVSMVHVEMPAAPVTTVSTRIPVTRKIFTPIPTDTPSQASPLGTGCGIIATMGAALLVIKRR